MKQLFAIAMDENFSLNFNPNKDMPPEKVIVGIRLLKGACDNLEKYVLQMEELKKEMDLNPPNPRGED